LWQLVGAALIKKHPRAIGFVVGSLVTFCSTVLIYINEHGLHSTEGAPFFTLFGLIAACGPGGTLGSMIGRYSMRTNSLRVLGCGRHLTGNVEMAIPADIHFTEIEWKAFKHLALLGWIGY